MKNYAKVAALLGLSAVTLSAAGYKIPQQSLNSMALGAAYVAAADDADTSYYNPANMVWLEKGSHLEVALTTVYVPSTKYTDSANSAFDAEAEKGIAFIPTTHYVSPAFGDWRFGVSVIVPAGLTKEWKSDYQKATAEEFGLKVIELNTNLAYRVSDNFAVGFGIRGLHSSGVIKSTGVDPFVFAPLTRDMEADSIDFGYNLALSYKPIENLTLATTYRSKVDLTLEGDAKLSAADGDYDGEGSLTIPMPAELRLAIAYTMSKTTVEFVYEKTYWSAYKDLDFKYPTTLPGAILPAAFELTEKNWKDSNTYRLGASHKYSDNLKLMAGFGIDESPVPDSTLGFETPDSDAYLYSAGFEYKINSDMSMGMAYLFSDKDDRSVSRAAPNPNGTFSNSSAHLVTASFKYKF